MRVSVDAEVWQVQNGSVAAMLVNGCDHKLAHGHAVDPGLDAPVGARRRGDVIRILNADRDFCELQEV